MLQVSDPTELCLPELEIARCRQEMLVDIGQTAVEASWSKDQYGLELLQVSLPYDCTIEADENGVGLRDPNLPLLDNILYVTGLFVPPVLRQAGIGERLGAKVIEEAGRAGFRHLSAIFSNPLSLRILRKLVDDKNIYGSLRNGSYSELLSPDQIEDMLGQPVESGDEIATPYVPVIVNI